MPKIAVFPGSFDPFTNGHLATVKRAAKLFDEVVIAIMTNTSKQSLFLPEEKLSLTTQAVAELTNVRVVAHENALTVQLAHALGAQFLVRGIRNAQDYEYEKNIALMNQELDETIETVFLIADESLSKISSSIVKEIASFQGDVSKFLPDVIHQAVIEKYRNK